MELYKAPRAVWPHVSCSYYLNHRKTVGIRGTKGCYDNGKPRSFSVHLGQTQPPPGTESNLRLLEKVQYYSGGTRDSLLGDGCRLGREGFPEEVALKMEESQKYIGVPGSIFHCELLGPPW